MRLTTVRLNNESPHPRIHDAQAITLWMARGTSRRVVRTAPPPSTDRLLDHLDLAPSQADCLVSVSNSHEAFDKGRYANLNELYNSMLGLMLHFIEGIQPSMFRQEVELI